MVFWVSLIFYSAFAISRVQLKILNLYQDFNYARKLFVKKEGKKKKVYTKKEVQTEYVYDVSEIYRLDEMLRIRNGTKDSFFFFPPFF